MSRILRQIVFGGGLLAVLVSPLRGQAPVGVDNDSGISVSLVTFGPGEASWERFGHNAIWIRDPSTGVDKLYDYGRFSFRQENFLRRFIRGRMLYWTAAEQSEAVFRRYQAVDRSIYVQDLDLTPAQRVQLAEYLEWNIRAENRFYPYHYYKDNCSTRIRDAIDRVLGGAIKQQTSGEPTEHTFRSHTQRLTSNNPLLYTGLLIGLGNPVDQPITAWEDMFIPMQLRDHIRNVTVTGTAGAVVPLVQAERTLYESTLPLPADRPPRWTLWYLVIGLVVAATFVLLGRAAGSKGLKRGIFTAVTVTWCLVIGFLGVVLIGLWLFTDHDTSFLNENVLFFSPLALPLAAFLPTAVYRAGKSARPALLFGVVVAVSAVIGLVIQVFPGFDQVNGQLIALMVPANVGLLLGLMARLDNSGQAIGQTAGS